MPSRNTRIRAHRTGGAEQVLSARAVPTIPQQPEPMREGCRANDPVCRVQSLSRAEERIASEGSGRRDCSTGG